jgi:hypothetical protein
MRPKKSSQSAKYQASLDHLVELHSYSGKDESSQIMDQTNHRGTLAITQKVYQPALDQWDKYYERMKQKYHIFWPNIKQVLAIT